MLSKITLIVCIVLLSIPSVLAIGVSPSKIHMEHLRKGMSATSVVYLSDVGEGRIIQYDVESEVADWIAVEVNYSARKDSKVPLIISAQIPTTAANGIYTARIDLSPTSGESSSSSNSVNFRAAVPIHIKMEVTGQEIKEFRVLTTILGNGEVGEELPITFMIENTGNVDVRPKALFEILDMDRTVVLKKDNKNLDSVPLMATTRSTVLIDHEQEIGNYWIHIMILDGSKIVWDEFLPFEIFSTAYFDTEISYLLLREIKNSPLGSVIRLAAESENTGSIATQSIMVAEITKDDVLVDVVKSEAVYIQPGEIVLLEAFFTPKDTGTYSISSYVVYEGRKTPTKNTVFVVGKPSNVLTGNSVMSVITKTYSIKDFDIPVVPVLLIIIVLAVNIKRWGRGAR